MSFTQEQRDAILWYVSETPPTINYILRDENTEIYDEEKQLAYDMINLIYNTPVTTKPLTLYRGIPDVKLEDDFIDYALISTSLDKDMALNFTINGKYLYKIIVEVGTPYLYIPKEFGFQQESEVILQPGSFKYIKTKNNTITVKYQPLINGYQQSIDRLNNFFNS